MSKLPNTPTDPPSMSWPPFITLDGIDGVGKSTQIRAVEHRLRELGHDVLAVRDPGSTPVGAELRGLLLSSELEIHRRTEAMLFMASRCEMVESVIRPALEAGKIVISDRFLLSTVVYQSVGATAVDPAVLWQLGRLANANLCPDLTILLDLPAADAMRRIQGAPDRMEGRGARYLESVREGFRNQLPHSSRHTAVVNAAEPIAVVTGNVLAAVEACLANRTPRE